MRNPLPILLQTINYFIGLRPPNTATSNFTTVIYFFGLRPSPSVIQAADHDVGILGTFTFASIIPSCSFTFPSTIPSCSFPFSSLVPLLLQASSLHFGFILKHFCFAYHIYAQCGSRKCLRGINFVSSFSGALIAATQVIPFSLDHSTPACRVMFFLP